MSGLPARSTARQKRNRGNAATVLARKVTRAGNEADILIAFTFHLRSGCKIGCRMSIAYPVINIAYPVIDIAFTNFPHFKQYMMYTHFLWQSLFRIIKLNVKEKVMATYSEI